MPYKDVLKIQPRDYQKKIFETCQKESCLVVLPTGTGKTLLAVMLAIERFKKYPLKKVLMLAPTRPLIEQHLASFKKHIEGSDTWADMQIFTGKTPAEKRKKIWQTAEFIFSTPQCISNDLKKELYTLDDVSLLIEDECHRCLKNYSYNFIAQKYKEQAKEDPRVLGLTASPGSNKETITKVCENLGISAVEIRTRQSPDVKPYLQELEFEKIELDFPGELEVIRQLLKEIYDQKVAQLKDRRLFFGPANKISLLKLQERIMTKLRQKNKDPSLFSAASTCAQAIKISHAQELLETQTASSFIAYLKDMFKQAAEKKSKAVQILTKDPRFGKAFSLANSLSREHPKLEKLIEIIKNTLEKNPKSKIIVFAQFRETVRKISEEINKLDKGKAKVFVGQAIKKHNSHGKKEETTGLKQKEQKQVVQEFSEGKINVLVATSIAEEGLDIPEVNEVIFYEPVPSAIRKIQRAGRTARLMPGSLKILITKQTRDIAYHYASQAREKKMHNVLTKLKSDLENKTDDEKENQEKLFK